MLWDTSVATCSIDQVGTSFVRRSDLYAMSAEECRIKIGELELTRSYRFLKILDCLFLAGKT